MNAKLENLKKERIAKLRIQLEKLSNFVDQEESQESDWGGVGDLGRLVSDLGETFVCSEEE